MNRAEWQALRDELRGNPPEDLEMRTTVRSDSVNVEYGEGVSDVEATLSPHVTDLRVGSLQLLTTRDRTLLLVAVGPYPINEWRVLYDSDS